MFLLLLQKREEASINFAVVKPTIKVIDYPIADENIKFPDPKVIYVVSLFLSIFLPFIIIYFNFLLDNKIHNKDQLRKALNNDITILGEIPFISDMNAEKLKSSRSVISESMRIVNSNLKFLLRNNEIKQNRILVTSSIKGEGKTLVSFHLSKVLSSSYKTILVGADLRNPQLHNSLGINKTGILGVTDLIFKKDNENYENYISNHDGFEIIFSGTIPPNPTELISRKEFSELINILSEKYDYVIIDSAPCLLVSDTFEILSETDTVLYLFRSNFTDSSICEFINQNHSNNKFPNLAVILNGVGNSGKFGYKYGYQYGYQYNYKYGYRYDYGYGYQYGDKN